MKALKVLCRPLLDESGLQELYQRAHAASTPYSQRLLEQYQSGDVASRYRGSGMDYEESRLYQAGDEPRFLNWRVTARTGQAHVKQFREERRPGVFLLVDHRQSMRFGTRVRLKATQATRFAALVAFAAVQQGWTVSGLLLENDTHWFPVSPDSQSIWQFVRECAGPCPPLETVDEPPLQTILPLIQNQLVRGTHVYLISDFVDLDEACKPHLLQLANHHPVFALHILDPVELELPDAGKIILEGMAGEIEQEVDCSDTDLRATFHRKANARQANIEQQLKGFACEYFRLMTKSENPESRIPLPHGIGT